MKDRGIRKIPGMSWITINGKCYEFVTEQQLTWIKSKQFCERRGSVLAILDSEQINNDITSAVTENFPTSTFWIGAYDQSHEGQWVWDAKGTNISYSNWGNGEPNGGTGENCATLAPTGDSTAWEDDNCNKESNFICQKLPDECGVVTIPDSCSEPTVAPSSCDPPFADFGGGCFFVPPGNYSVLLSWFEARDMCDTMGAKLGYILNSQEEDALTAFMTAQTFPGNCNYWIGLNDLNNDRIWTWEGINQPANYTRWYPGFPGELYYQCVYTNTACIGGWGNIYACSDKHLFICRK